jgi:hypothetical protein
VAERHLADQQTRPAGEAADQEREQEKAAMVRTEAAAEVIVQLRAMGMQALLQAAAEGALQQTLSAPEAP